MDYWLRFGEAEVDLDVGGFVLLITALEDVGSRWLEKVLGMRKVRIFLVL